MTGRPSTSRPTGLQTPCPANAGPGYGLRGRGTARASLPARLAASGAADAVSEGSKTKAIKAAAAHQRLRRLIGAVTGLGAVKASPVTFLAFISLTVRPRPFAYMNIARRSCGRKAACPTWLYWGACFAPTSGWLGAASQPRDQPVLARR